MIRGKKVSLVQVEKVMFTEGAIGCRKMSNIAQAFSVKLLWSFRQKPSLWAIFIRVKYYWGFHPCIADPILSSHVWERIILVKELAEDRFIYFWFINEG